MARRRRELGEEEQVLWRKVTETVAPLKPRRSRKAAAKAPEGLSEPPHDDAPVSAPVLQRKPPQRPEHAETVVPASPPKKPAIRPLVPIDTRTKRKIARGAIEVTARIDLHGMTQREAFSALRAFLARTQMAGGRLAIVITGKGRPGAADLVFDPNERGVLRRVVPQWLSSPDLRDLVGGFEEAAPGHGGGGALYVRLRRPRQISLG